MPLFPLVSHDVQRLAAGLSERHYNLGRRIVLSCRPGVVYALSQLIKSPVKPTNQITVGDMIHALRALKARTGDNALSHTVRQGEFRLVRVEMDAKGKSTVTPLSPWQSAAAHLATLNNYGNK